MAGFKTFTSATLSSADVNGYLMKQAVIQCTSSTRPSSPHDGMTVYETDTGATVVYSNAQTAWREVARNGTPATRTCNMYQASYIIGSTAHVALDGRWIAGEVAIDVGGGGSAGTAIRVDFDISPYIPAPAATIGLISCGSFLYNDSGTGVYQGTVRAEAASGSVTRFTFWSVNGGSSLGAAPSFAVAIGDTFNFNFRYRW